MKNALTKLGFIFLGWTLLALLQVSSIVLYRSTIGAPARFFLTLHFALLDYWIWAALTPIIFFLAWRFPFRSDSWLPTTAIHFFFYLLLTLTHEALALLAGFPTPAPASYHGPVLWLRFISSLYDDLWMYWPAVVIWSLLDYYQRYRERDKRAAQLKEELTRAELQALRNQLHPHFLFNTLNSVASLMHEDVEAADDMLADLSHLLRAYLRDNDDQEIRLRQEMQLLDTYIRIQKRRFEGRLISLFDVPRELLDAAVPSLLLQPLVENSILHGIAPSVKPGYVRVTVRTNGPLLTLEVADNGLGLPKDYTERIGLSNTRSRLRHLYGDRQSFELQDAESGGVAVNISIPLRFFPADASHDSMNDVDTEHADPNHVDTNHADTNHDHRRRSAGSTANSVVAQNR